jgi:hypothetical protein
MAVRNARTSSDGRQERNRRDKLEFGDHAGKLVVNTKSIHRLSVGRARMNDICALAVHHHHHNHQYLRADPSAI